MSKTKAKRKPKPKRGRPSGAKSPKVKTEGQRLLLEVSGTEGEMAKSLGCSPAVVGHWKRGRRVPQDGAARQKLNLLFGIPPRAWDVKPGEAIEPKQQDPAGGQGSSTLEITCSQIAAIETALGNEALTDTNAARLRDTLGKMLALRARMERDSALEEDRVVREHPEWLRVKAAIIEALRPYPDAAAAVAEVLE